MNIKDLPKFPSVAAPEAAILFAIVETRDVAPHQVRLGRNLPKFLAAVRELQKLGWTVRRAGNRWSLDGEIAFLVHNSHTPFRNSVDQWCSSVAEAARVSA